MTRHITMLIAHPDDEVIFGWPVLKQAKRIVCCSSDLHNPERQWCKDRKLALKEVGDLVGAEVVCLDHPSEFYRTNARNGSLHRLVTEVLSLIKEEELLFTHNLWGEYGHLDHILVHQIGLYSGKKIVCTDITLGEGWMPVRNMVNPLSPVGHFMNDLSLYEKCKAIYDRYGCWTWNRPPIMGAHVYESHNGCL